MIDEHEQVVRELRAERDQLRGRVSELDAAVERQRFEAELERELAKHVTGLAATTSARLLAQEAVRSAGGALCVPKYGFSAETIAAEFLRGEGAYLKTTAPREKPPAGEGATGKRDVQRAKGDSKYLEEWQKADPEGFAKAWSGELNRMVDAARLSRVH